MLCDHRDFHRKLPEVAGVYTHHPVLALVSVFWLQLMGHQTLTTIMLQSSISSSLHSHVGTCVNMCGCLLISSLLPPGGFCTQGAQVASGSEAQTELHRPGSLLEPGNASSVERLERTPPHLPEQ